MNSLPKSQIPLMPNLWALVVLTICIFSFGVYASEWRDVGAYVANSLHLDLNHDALVAIIVLLLMTIPMLLVDVWKFIVKPKVFDAKASIIALKTIGIWAAYCFIGFLYWLLPEYGSWYQSYWVLLENVMPFIFGVTPLYVWVVTAKQAEPKDAYLDAAYLFLGFFSPSLWGKCRGSYLAELARQWLVKGFFLPLMLIYFFGNVSSLLDFKHPSGSPTVSYFYDFSYVYLFSIDLAFAAIGYIFTLKMLDTDIRSTEPSVLGWIACLMCYSPFWNGLFEPTYFHYNDGLYWGEWLGEHPFMYAVWASVIIALTVVYALATVSLGYRFSNLTYRGLATTGVFRLTKHPAYVFKNLTWWMISIPFIPSGDWVDATRSCILLLGVNLIYFTRAKTEERHLSQYPEYVEYANWINEHGIFRWVVRIFPSLRYNSETTLNVASKVWWRKAGLLGLSR